MDPYVIPILAAVYILGAAFVLARGNNDQPRGRY